MSNSRPNLNIWALSLPIFIENLANGLIVFVDTWFLSRLGDGAAGTVGVIAPYFWLGWFVLPTLASGATSLAAQYMGAKKHHHIVPTYMANMLLITALGTIFAIFTVIFSGKIGLWFGLPQELNTFSTDYAGIFGFGFIFFSLRVSYGSILISKGLTQWNMIASFATDISNVVFNSIFFFGLLGFPKMGVRGIALGTVIAYAIGTIAVALIVHLKIGFRFEFNNIFNRIKTVFAPMLELGVPTAIEPANYTIQQIVVASIIARLGVVAMGANTYVQRFHFIVMGFGWAMSVAAQVNTAYFKGAKEYLSAKRAYNKTVSYAVIFALVNCVLLALFHKQFLLLFTNDEQIIKYVFLIFLLGFVMEPFRQINIVGGTALKAVGDGKFVAIVGTIFIWGLIPFVYLFGFHLGFGIVGVWACFAVDELIRGIINHTRWLSGVWQRRSIVSHDSTVNE